MLLAECLRIEHQCVERQALYQVWIDLNFGEESPDWWWNSPPQTLRDAVAESMDAKRMGWVTQVLPEGTNPRPDGRWDNP